MQTTHLTSTARGTSRSNANGVRNLSRVLVQGGITKGVTVDSAKALG